MRNIFLLLASLLFYAWGEGLYIVVMLFSIAFNYVIARLFVEHQGYNRFFFIIGIFGNLFLLILFKYSEFIVQNLNVMLIWLGLRSIEFYDIHLPIGISFFTFQSISYLIDVRKNPNDIQRNPIDLGLYISLFPQLIAGPIVRFTTIKRQLVSRVSSLPLIMSGSERFIIGLFKKVVLANGLGAFTDEILSYDLKALDTPATFLATLAYSFQIYFDFSGYSDMAIGLGRIFGFKFLENFMHPYSAISIKDFWRKWHISLSSWFRDYLYIPLGGNRKGESRTYINLITIFFLTGLWHGASWNFVLWGLFHGTFLILERIGLSNILKRLPNLINRLYVWLVILISWVFFRIENLDDAIIALSNLFRFQINAYSISILSLNLTNNVVFLFIVASIFSFPLYSKIKKITKKLNYVYRPAYYAFLIVVFVISLSFLASSGYNPFIYFRF